MAEILKGASEDVEHAAALCVPRRAHGGPRDLHGELSELFQDPAQVAFYLAAVGAVGVHLWVGWGKTVQKADEAAVPKAARAGVVALGRALVVPLCVGFAACPLFFALGA